ALDRAAAAGHRNPDPGPGRAEAAGRKEAGSGRGMGPEPDPVPGRDRAADIDHHTAVDKEHCRTAEAAGTLPGLDLEVAPGFGPALDTERMNWDTGGLLIVTLLRGLIRESGLLRLILLARLVRRRRRRPFRRAPHRVTLILSGLLRVPDLKIIVDLAYTI